MPVMAKTCTKCGADKPATLEFYYSEKDGLTTQCRECRKSAVAAYRLAHPDRVSESKRRCVAAKPEQYKSAKHAYHAANREHLNAASRRWHAEHREEAKQRLRLLYEANREMVKARTRRWAATHPELVAEYHRNAKARRKGVAGTHSASDVRAQYERQHGRCFWCKAKVDRYHVDHVMPLALGGSNGPENIVIACPTCNMSKQAKHPMDFAGVLL